MMQSQISSPKWEQYHEDARHDDCMRGTTILVVFRDVPIGCGIVRLREIRWKACRISSCSQQVHGKFTIKSVYESLEISMTPQDVLDNLLDTFHEPRVMICTHNMACSLRERIQQKKGPWTIVRPYVGTGLEMTVLVHVPSLVSSWRQESDAILTSSQICVRSK